MLLGGATTETVYEESCNCRRRISDRSACRTEVLREVYM